MKNASLISITLIFALFLSCKKSTSYVEVHGKVLNFATKQAVPSTIQLWGGGMPGTNAAVHTADATIGSDGSFYMKGDVEQLYYTLVIQPYNSQGFEKYVSLKPGQNTDVGDILTGTYTYYFKVNLVSTSNSAIDFTSFTSPQTHYNAGTNTTFLISQKFASEGYINSNGKYSISYKTYPNGIETDSSISITLPSPPDTSYITITY